MSKESELEQVRSSLKESKRRLSLALNSANAGIWDWNLKTDEEYWDENTEKLFGLEPGSFEGTYEGFAKRVHPEDLPALEEATQEAIDNRGTFQKEFRIQTDDGEERWLLSQGKVYTDSEDNPEKMIGVTIDVTEKKEMKQALRETLEQKELLIDEIHHRVKNNLQVISSMLRMQSNLLPESAEAKEHLEESQLRIHAMGMIHEHLYNSGVTEQMLVGKYIRNLVQEIIKIHQRGDADPNVQFDIDGDVRLGPDEAVSCGIIINELVTNALMHAFPEGKEDPWIRVGFKAGDQYQLFVEDNGQGLPDQFSPEESGSLGMEIVRSMSRQLAGRFSVEDTENTRFSVYFPT